MIFSDGLDVEEDPASFTAQFSTAVCGLSFGWGTLADERLPEHGLVDGDALAIRFSLVCKVM